MNKKFKVRYRLANEYCKCCDRYFDELKFSEDKHVVIDLLLLLEETKWDKEDYFEEDCEEIVENYIYDVISIYTSSSQRINITEEDVLIVCEAVDKYMKSDS